MPCDDSVLYAALDMNGQVLLFGDTPSTVHNGNIAPLFPLSRHAKLAYWCDPGVFLEYQWVRGKYQVCLPLIGGMAHGRS